MPLQLLTSSTSNGELYLHFKLRCLQLNNYLFRSFFMYKSILIILTGFLLTSCFSLSQKNNSDYITQTKKVKRSLATSEYSIGKLNEHFKTNNVFCYIYHWDSQKNEGNFIYQGNPWKKKYTNLYIKNKKIITHLNETEIINDELKGSLNIIFTTYQDFLINNQANRTTRPAPDHSEGNIVVMKTLNPKGQWSEAYSANYYQSSNDFFAFSNRSRSISLVCYNKELFIKETN